MGDVQNEGAAFRMMAGGLDTVAKLSSPRVIKSHLPLYLLNPSLLDTCKVIHRCKKWSPFHSHRPVE